jgi:hypothetical protein
MDPQTTPPAGPEPPTWPAPRSSRARAPRRPKRFRTRQRSRAMLMLTLAAGIAPGGIALLSLLWLVGAGEGRSLLKWALVVAVGLVAWL